MFEDPGQKIKELTFLVKKDLGTIRKKIDHLDEAVKLKDMPTKQSKHHSETLVGALQGLLHSQSIQFTEALETRTKVLERIDIDF